MKYNNQNFSFSASDVSLFLSCRHATQLHRQYAVENKKVPKQHDPVLEVLIARGEEHEKAYVSYLVAQKYRCTDGERKSFDETLAAMQEGVDVIVQGCLVDGVWSGYPDILVRVAGKSIFGDWMYEVQDTKLSSNTRTSAIIQLCFYTDLLTTIQRMQPKQISVVIPGDPFIIESYHYNDFKAYYAFIKRSFKSVMDAQPLLTYPDPVEHCNICNWWKICDNQRRKDDHLSLVAGMRKLQVEELYKQQIKTLESFAEAKIIGRPERGNHAALVRRQSQAQIQFEGRLQNTLIHRSILPIEEKRGFNRLPEISRGDVYLDIEGDAFYRGGSFEYLFGIAFFENDELRYQTYWSTTRAEEKKSFEQLMIFILKRMIKYPGLSIYHYAPYEPSTIKRLAHQYAVYETELDDLLRNGKFVDLHAVVKESILASVERYSLKDIEKFAGYTRIVDLREAGLARKQVESALQLHEFKSLPQETIDKVQVYNQDDCLATESLHRWLEIERHKLVSTGESILRPVFTSDPPEEKLLDLERRSKLFFESLTKDLPADTVIWTDEDRAKWLLANQLQYFQRENKTAWWEHFRLQNAEYEDLIDERNALVHLSFQQVVPSKGLPVHRYAFPEQETTLDIDDALYVVNSCTSENPIGISLGKIVAIDCIRNTVDIKKTAKASELHPQAVHAYNIITIEKLWRSILSIAQEVDENGLNRMGDFWAAKDLLMKRKPQLVNAEQGAIRNADETPLDAAIRIALKLNRSILPIQGPPGTGKTFTGAQMIIQLIKARKKVGVTAVSHRVVTTLFEAVRKEADKLNVSLDFVHKVSEKMDMPDWIKQHTDKNKVKTAIGNYAVAGGTAWLWADDDLVDSLDYLFIDEAGQMSLSQAMAASRATQNIILLGDPQQLEQPQRGAHPEGSGVAALTHLLEGQSVMPPEKGLFLNVTRRIGPEIAKFTSEVFYTGKLGTLEGLENQKITGGTAFDGGGLFYVPVDHNGNQNHAEQEIDKIHVIIADLMEHGSWTDNEGKSQRISVKDILVVAPYNAQVDALRERLPNIDVGTVDKFQGREAPVVIYSMTASTVEDAPRGMNFLFNPNRLNVATSRAKCICILVASSTLLTAECNTIEQMRWANALCRYRELSAEVVL
jgi:uncharacterized protein